MSINSGIQKPLVSVIIPTYNRPVYLKEAIESVVQQTYQNIEIIVSDDYSSQSPQGIVDSFQDARIRFRRNQTNLGIALNASAAFQAARGKYVAALNDDDIWNKDFLEKLVPHLENNSELALAFCDYYVINPDSTINYQSTEQQTRQEKRDQLKEGIYQPCWKIALLDRSIFSASAALIRNDAVEWDQLSEAGVYWDYYVTYLACRSGRGAYYFPERLSRYRLSPHSLTRSTDAQAKMRKGKAGLFCHGRMIEDPRLQEFKPYFRHKWVEASTSMGIGLLRAKQLKEARPYFLDALKQEKFNLRTLVALTLSFTPPSLASRF